MASDVKWIKITTDIFDDEKILLIESLPAADSIIVIWFKLLTFAGKQNNDGVFLMSNRIAYTDEMLASIFRRNINDVRLALTTFQNYGMIEVVDNVITIPNWGKHQTLDAYEKKKKRDRERIAKKRAEQKALIAKSPDLSPDKSPDVAVSEEEREEDKDKEQDREGRKRKKSKTSEEANLTVASILGANDYSLFDHGVSELQTAILSFMEFRKSIKKPMTDRAVDLLVKKLKDMTPSVHEQVEIINQSIMNGWQGVFPLKNEQVQAGKKTGQQTQAPRRSGGNVFLDLIDDEGTVIL